MNVHYALPWFIQNAINLNVVDAEIIKNAGSDRFWICMFCSNN